MDVKRYVTCMSKSRRDLRGDLEENTKPCAKHLIKLFLYPNSSHVERWRKEVYNFYPYVPRLKPRNKVPSAKFIYDNTWGTNKHLLLKLINRVIFEESECTPDSSRMLQLSYLELQIDKYFWWLAETLHAEELANQYQVITKLRELGF